MAMLIKVNGEQVEVKPKNGKKFTFEEVKEYIGGGFVEHVSIGKLAVNGKEKAIWVDENGKLKGFPHNPVGSAIVRGRVLGDIVGDMLLTDEDEVD